MGFGKTKGDRNFPMIDSMKDYKELRPDPHGFDGDYDGIGCETYHP